MTRRAETTETNRRRVSRLRPSTHFISCSRTRWSEKMSYISLVWDNVVERKRVTGDCYFSFYIKKTGLPFFGLEYIASERVAGSITNNVAENLQILRIMGYIEDPWRKQRRKSQHKLNINIAGRNNIYFVRFSASHLYMASCITSILLSSHVHSFLLRSKQGKCQGLYCKCSI